MIWIEKLFSSITGNKETETDTCPTEEDVIIGAEYVFTCYDHDNPFKVGGPHTVTVLDAKMGYVQYFMVNSPSSMDVASFLSMYRLKGSDE